MIDDIATDAALAVLKQRSRKRLYLHDPVLWANDYLGIQLWSKQREILCAVRDNRKVAVAAGHGVGKDLPLDTPIATPGGWSTIGELKEGDYVYDERGVPCRVVGKSEVFNLPLYEITFSDGAKVRTSSTHEWNTIDARAAKRLRRRGGVQDWRDHWGHAETRETGEIADTLHYSNGANKFAANHIVPISGALEGEEIWLPMDPYVTGAWLGDGTSVRAEMTIGADSEYIIDEFAKSGYVLSKTPAGECRYTFARQGALQALRDLDLMGNKHIPSDYQRASVAQRRELLRGLMDTDGFVCHGTICGIDLMNEELAYDVVELIRGLGVRASITPSRTYLDGRDVGTRYRIVFNPTWSPFTQGQYKDAKWQARGGAAFVSQSRRTMRTIVSVEPVPSVPTQCIQVDSESHLYLATENLIPTHNSFVAAVLMAWWIDVHPLGADETGAPQTFVASTAPFSDQISAILWNNLRILHALSKARFDRGEVDHALPGYITGDNKWKTNDGVLIGQGRKPPDSKTDSGYQGLHATYLLAIGDEAAGLSADMIDALGNITTGPHNRMLLIANPTDPSSAMAQIWKTNNPLWLRMHISVFDSPRVTGEEGFDISKAPALSGQEYIDEKLEEWGEDDPRYQSRVMGQWAFDAGNNLFTDVDIARAAGLHVRPDPDGVVYFGADIARMGGDATFLYARRPGEVWEVDPETGKPTVPTGRRGNQVRYLDSWVKTPLTTGDLANPGTAERIHSHALAVGAKWVMVDASGLGSGVIDGLAIHNRGHYGVVEVFGSAAPTDKRGYLNARAEAYFDLKRQMFSGELDLDPADSDLFDELRTVVFEYTDRGQRKIESKDSMKKRGVKSPDRADALSYAALDITPITGNPLAGMEKGDILAVDPWDLLDDYQLHLQSIL